MAGPPQNADKVARSTVLIIGKGETMDAGLRVALDRHGLQVEEASGDPKAAVAKVAPDLVLLIGDAARDGGRAILEKLGGGSGSAASVPVAVLGALGKLDTKLQAFRHGAVAVVPRTASVDAIAMRVAALTKEVQDRSSQNPEELGEATFDELVDLVSHELRSGILSVQGKDGDAMRIVLGAGRPVADAVEEFVRRLRPLVSRAEPLTYEIHSPTGGAVGLLDLEPGNETDPSLLAGLRVLLVDTDPARADAIAQELRARKVVVAVADASGRGLERARGLDPEVVILDAAGIEGPGFEVVRAIRRDVRLRWASMLVAPWDDIWPTPESTPDVARLAERIAPLVENDRALRARVATEAAFDARLESTGPCRFLRILATSPSPIHAVFRSRAAVVEVDVAEGLIVGAQGSRGPSDPLEGLRAIAALLAMGAARVHVERRANPSVANLMAPVDEALAQAAAEVAPIAATSPPPKIEPKNSMPARRRPFPAASELRAGAGEPGPDNELDSVVGLPRGVAAHADNPLADARDLRWSDTDDPGDEPAHGKLVSGGAPAASAKAAFGLPAGGATSSELRPGGLFTSARPGPVRKPTLAMGGPVPAGVVRAAMPTPFAPADRPETFASRNPTVTMGSAHPAPPPAADESTAVPSALVPAPFPNPLVPSPRAARAAPKRTLLGVAMASPGAAGRALAPAVEQASAEARTAADDDGLAALLEPGGDGSAVLDPLDELPSRTPDPLLDTLPSVEEASSGASAPIDAPIDTTSEPTMRSSPPEFAIAPAMPPSPDETFSQPPPAVAVAPPLALDVPSPASRGGGARVVGLALVAVGLVAVALLGGFFAWVRVGGGSVESLLALVGAGPPITATPLDGNDAGTAFIAFVPSPDAGSAPLAVVLPDVGVAENSIPDAGRASAMPDAGTDAGTTPAVAIIIAPEVIPPDVIPPEVIPPEVIPPALSGESVEALIARAERLPPADAEPLFRRALELDSRDHHAMIALAELLIELGRPTEAIPLIENAIARRRTRAAYRVLLGDARRAAGDASGAAAAWREALELEPDNRQARSRLGE